MADSIRVEHNALAVAAAINRHGDLTMVRARAITRHHGLLLQAAVKRNASKPRTGPPGPRIQTGDYVRSIALSMSGNAAFSTAEVGTDKPQGRRLEFGYVGMDALGRNYNQPPYPHFGPALDEVGELFQVALLAAATEGW